jgi:hypothetical protein
MATAPVAFQGSSWLSPSTSCLPALGSWRSTCLLNTESFLVHPDDAVGRAEKRGRPPPELLGKPDSTPPVKEFCPHLPYTGQDTSAVLGQKDHALRGNFTSGFPMSGPTLRGSLGRRAVTLPSDRCPSAVNLAFRSLGCWNLGGGVRRGPIGVGEDPSRN